MEGQEKLEQPQCQFLVVRKKRLCRMTIRPGRQYCAEHEPEPSKYSDREGHDDCDRVPCPYDFKHTCYVSRLQSHLLVCNARPRAPPPYVVRDVNAPPVEVTCARTPLSEVPKDKLMQVIRKMNHIYEKYVEQDIGAVDEGALHPGVAAEWAAGGGRARRHLRQASALLRLAERARLVADGTCYVELGAGRGQLSQYASWWWGGGDSGGGGGGSAALLVDRASPRHKRDGRVAAGAGGAGGAGSAGGAGAAVRLRADLRHLSLAAAPAAAAARALVGLAKHLCGVATDYALRCMTADGVLSKTRGLVLATCCHHRCEPHQYVGAPHLKKLDISEEDLNVLLGVVSWATCGDGRSRDARPGPGPGPGPATADHDAQVGTDDHLGGNTERSWSKHQGGVAVTLKQCKDHADVNGVGIKDVDSSMATVNISSDARDKVARAHAAGHDTGAPLSRERREEAGRRAKAVLDWGRALYLREKGFQARLCHFVPTSVSLENMCIVASKEINGF